MNKVSGPKRVAFALPNAAAIISQYPGIQGELQIFAPAAEGIAAQSVWISLESGGLEDVRAFANGLLAACDESEIEEAK